MIRRAVVLVLLGCGVAVASSASGAPERSVPIRLGVGIGPINLGMGGQQVRRALGKPTAVVERRVIGGRPYIEFDYGLGRWNVGLLGRKGSRRVVLVGTGLERHRTPQGLGVGSTARQVERGLRGSRQRICGFGNGHWYHRRGATETVFHPARYENVAVAVDVRSAPVLGCAF
jgi:hypothetical protein